MVRSVQQRQQLLRSQQQQVAEAKRILKKQREAIPETTQRQLRTGQALRGRQVQRQLETAREDIQKREQEILKAETQVTQTQKEIESYLRTEAGKLQYAKEQGLKGKAIKGRIGRGYAITTIGIEYDTPYGKVIDYSPRERQLQREAKVISTLTPQEAEVYFAPEIERGLEEKGITYERKNGEIVIKDVPKGVKDINVTTLFGREKVRLEQTEVPPEQITIPEPKKVVVEQKKVDFVGVPEFKKGQKIETRGLELIKKDVRKVKESITRVGKGISTMILTPKFTKEDLKVKEEVSKFEKGTMIQPKKDFKLKQKWVAFTTFPETSTPKTIEEVKRTGRRIKKATEKVYEEITGISLVTGELTGKGPAYETIKFTQKIAKPITEKTKPLVIIAGSTEKAEVTRAVLETPTPITAKGQEEILRGIYTFAFFSPAMQTAAVQQSQYADEVVEVILNGQKVRMLKSEAIRRGLQYGQPTGYGAREAQIYLESARTTQEKFSRARDIMKFATDKQKALEFIKRIYGDTFAKDFVSQEFGITIFTPKPKPTVTKQVTIPASRFAGTGQYELTQAVIPRLGIGVAKGLQTGQLKGIEFTAPFLTLLGRQKQEVEQLTKQDTTFDRGIDWKLFSVTDILQDTKTDQDTITRQRTKQITTPITITVPRLDFVTTPTTIQTPEVTTTTTQIVAQKPGRPTKKIPRFFWEKELREKEEAKQKVRRLFEVFVKRKGVDVKVGGFQALGKARGELRKELKTTLRASGFITRRGEKLKAKTIGLGAEFRPAKRDPFRVVQKRGRRLGTRAEVSKIQEARKRKAGSGFKWF